MNKPALRLPRTEEAVPPLRQSKERYLSELADLLQEHRGQWVAYTPTERVALGPDPEQVYRACCERGLKTGEFLLCRIEPEVTTELDI